MIETQYQKDIIFQIYHICKNRSPSKFSKGDIRFDIKHDKSVVTIHSDLIIEIDGDKITIKDLDYDDTRTLKINDLDNFDPASYTLTHGRDPFLMDNLPGVLLDILIRQLQKKDKPC